MEKTFHSKYYLPGATAFNGRKIIRFPMNKLWGLLPAAVLWIMPLISFAQSTDKAFNKLEKSREDNWPPQRIHGRSSLGYALQQTFKRHAEFCGFKIKEEGRDFVPPDASRFLGRRSLRTPVETADIAGGGLLFYIFHDQERSMPFSSLRFSPSKVFRLEGMPQPFAIHPDENFDAFVLTKTCGGYLKASLDAGIEPPYASFKAALDTDSRRESSVMAISGSFVSPLRVALEANDRRTAEAMMKLWQFYKDNPEYIGRAYYLREFQGVMIRHVSTAEENARIESEGAFNLSGPLPVRLKAAFGVGASKQSSFSGTDWQTILYADFDAAYRRESLFAPLPTPTEIRRYFESIRPLAYLGNSSAALVEGVSFQHVVELPGVPEEMTTYFWELETVASGSFDGTPALEAGFFSKVESSGCRFALSGKPARSYFNPYQNQRSGVAQLRYTIRSRNPVGGEYIRIQVEAETPTSIHPLAKAGRGEFNIGKKENRQFSLQWIFEVEVEDADNPVDFNVAPYIEKLSIRNADTEMPVRLVDVQADGGRRRFFITLESVETWSLDRINDNDLQPYNLSLDLHLKSRRADTFAVRPVQGAVYLPGIRPPALPATEGGGE